MDILIYFLVLWILWDSSRPWYGQGWMITNLLLHAWFGLQICCCSLTLWTISLLISEWEKREQSPWAQPSRRSIKILVSSLSSTLSKGHADIERGLNLAPRLNSVLVRTRVHNWTLRPLGFWSSLRDFAALGRQMVYLLLLERKKQE